jgi:hypothetical protein
MRKDEVNVKYVVRTLERYGGTLSGFSDLVLETCLRAGLRVRLRPGEAKAAIYAAQRMGLIEKTVAKRRILGRSFDIWVYSLANRTS